MLYWILALPEDHSSQPVPPLAPRSVRLMSTMHDALERLRGATVDGILVRQKEEGYNVCSTTQLQHIDPSIHRYVMTLHCKRQSSGTACTQKICLERSSLCAAQTGDKDLALGIAVGYLGHSMTISAKPSVARIIPRTA